MSENVLPPELFTKDNVTPPDSLYEELAVEFPQYVRRNAEGVWEIDIWKERGIFSPAIKAFHARSAEPTIDLCAICGENEATCDHRARPHA